MVKLHTWMIRWSVRNTGTVVSFLSVSRAGALPPLSLSQLPLSWYQSLINDSEGLRTLSLCIYLINQIPRWPQCSETCQVKLSFSWKKNCAQLLKLLPLCMYWGLKRVLIKLRLTSWYFQAEKTQLSSWSDEGLSVMWCQVDMSSCLHVKWLNTILWLHI